jgi:hypothetical protein
MNEETKGRIRKSLTDMLNKSKGIALQEKDIDMVFKKLISENSQLLEGSPEKVCEFFILDEFKNILKIAKEEKNEPLDKVLDRYFEWKTLERKMSGIESKIASIGLADKKRIDEVNDAINEFVKETKKSNPEFLERYAERINEDYGDLMALGSGGRYGSIRKIKEMERIKRKKR